jgi:SnoaL-like polyketide cyclase
MFKGALSAQKGAVMAVQTDTDVVAENLRLMKAADDAFNCRDLDAMDALHHPEVVAYTTGAAEPTRILPPHRELIEDLIRAFPDVRVHNDPYPIQFGQGEWTTAISKMTGTFTGELIGPDGPPIPPTGKPFDVKFTTIGKWQNGQLVEEWVFWDQTLLLEQIGLAG